MPLPFVPFNIPCKTGKELDYLAHALASNHLSGDGPFSKKCCSWFENFLNCEKALLTPSCTHALEMAAILFDIQPGDEVIMPSYTFVSTANAFVLRGANIVFVDIRSDTMNIDETLIESAITDNTKVIVPVHYAGVACEMDVIMALANKYNLYVIEDAAQAMMSTYKGKALGTIGHLGTYSFHETKNYTSGGEGGLLIINDPLFVERAEIIREKGTNRSKFFKGMVDKYSWVDMGSSNLPSELQAAYLWSQLEYCKTINSIRRKCHSDYFSKLVKLVELGLIEIPIIPDYCKHNGHIFYIKVSCHNVRSELLAYLKTRGIGAVFHYIPLHDSVAGRKFGVFIGADVNTTKESERLIRLPLFYNITNDEINLTVNEIYKFYNITNDEINLTVNEIYKCYSITNDAMDLIED